MKGFGGVGGALRYKVDVDTFVDEDQHLGGEDFDADEDFIWAQQLPTSEPKVLIKLKWILISKNNDS